MRNFIFIYLTFLSFLLVTCAGKKEEKVEDSVSCFTCGLEEIDPEIDNPGSYGDERKEGTPAGKKMYNHTCDIADDLGLGDNWKRKCPPGTKSCFWAEGRYKKQTPVFRGCAESTYAFDPGCSRELQSVQIVVGKKSVDVEILLCFCTGDNCNSALSGASTLLTGILSIISPFIYYIIMK